MKRAALLLALGACASEPDPIQYSGETRRFVVDSIRLPFNNTEARELGADLDGDRAVDNQLGMVIGTLNTNSGNITTHGDEMIGAGALLSSMELVADDFGSDETVALRYFGSDGDGADVIGGSLDSGSFTTTTTGAGAVHLPVFVDSDPIVIPLVQMRAKLTPDGRGGFDATVQGAVDHQVALDAAFKSVNQMFVNRPGDHVVFFRLIDQIPQDFTVTQEEFEKNGLIAALLSPDITRDGTKLLSLGFRVHLSPCADGRCATQTAPSCFDRVRNGDESDVDCGGTCGACATGLSCSDASDCQTSSCNGTCAAPSCSDGKRDGFETDVDCGAQCGGCAAGRGCYSNIDCASGQCGAPCTGTFCGDYALDSCR